MSWSCLCSTEYIEEKQQKVRRCIWRHRLEGGDSAVTSGFAFQDRNNKALANRTAEDLRMSEKDEGPPTSTIMEMSTTYSQVVFNQVQKSYPPGIPVKCSYTVTLALQPHRRDWVGIFKVGWTTTRDYYTFVWTNQTPDAVDKEPKEPYVIFEAYYLPKEDGEFYQFCYVDSSGQVRGASTPFCFESPVECSMEYSFENDLLVITTQEQVEQVEKEKQGLQKEMEEQREATEILRSELDERLLEIKRLRDCNADLMKKMCILEKQQIESEKKTAREHEELQQAALQKKESETKAQTIQGEQQHFNLMLDHLQKENEDLKKTVSSFNESHEKATATMTHLKLEREDLKVKVKTQEVKIAQLDLKVRELEQEKGQCHEKQSKLQDEMQLLQVDLQSSQKENTKLCGELRQLRTQGQEMQALQNENQVLRRSLSKQDQDDEAQTQCSVLTKQLQKTTEQLQYQAQKFEDAQRQVSWLQQELEELKMQLTRGSKSLQEKEQMSSKLECQLMEIRRAADEQMCMTDLLRLEKEDLSKENEKLRRDVQRLREELSRIQAVPPSDPVSLQNPNPYSPSSAAPSTQNSMTSSLLFGNPFQMQDNTSTGEEKVCCYCKEAFPNLSPAELEQHEQNHKVCPYCSCICDSMEQTEFEDHVYNHED